MLKILLTLLSSFGTDQFPLSQECSEEGADRVKNQLINLIIISKLLLQTMLMDIFSTIMSIIIFDR